MLVVQPSVNHPIYVQWKKWFYKCQSTTGPAYWIARDARDSIELIAIYCYPDHPSIIGCMIMMKDTEEMEAEESATRGIFTEPG